MFAFVQDLEPGNYIEMIEFPTNGMDETIKQVTPTLTQLDLLLGANATLTIILAQATGAADMESLVIRNMVPIPHCYLHLLLTQYLTPQDAWEQVGRAIKSDRVEVDCKLLLQWLQGSLTNLATGNPSTYLGTHAMVFPPLWVDCSL